MFAITFSVATVDWLLSLDPRWSSTIFAVYEFAGVLVQGTAAVTLTVVVLLRRGLLRAVITEHHLHDQRHHDTDGRTAGYGDGQRQAQTTL